MSLLDNPRLVEKLRSFYKYVRKNDGKVEIIKAKDYALAAAAEPVFGEWGLWFTIAIAIVATFSGVIASVFSASRLLGMLSNMKQVPSLKKMGNFKNSFYNRFINIFKQDSWIFQRFSFC